MSAFQMLLARNTRQEVPGTGAATAPGRVATMHSASTRPAATSERRSEKSVLGAT